MHCPSIFREDRIEQLHGLIQAHPLATLVTNGPNGLNANLIPFSLHEGGDHGILRAHLARANKQLDDLRAGTGALVIFQGPACYITPTWYPSKAEHGRVVPTWNFAMVQVRGPTRVFDDPAWTRAQVERLTAEQENSRECPWAVADAPDEFIAAQLKGIVGIEIPIAHIEGKWKISQNRLPVDRQGVMDGLMQEGHCPGMLAMMTNSAD